MYFMTSTLQCKRVSEGLAVHLSLGQFNNGKGQHQNLTEIRYLYSVKIEQLTPYPLYLYSQEFCPLELLALKFYIPPFHPLP